MTAEQFFKKNPYRLGAVGCPYLRHPQPLLYAWELGKIMYQTIKDEPYSRYCQGLGTYIKTGRLV